MENNSLDTGYSGSGQSSPRSRENEFDNLPTLEDPLSNYKVKFMFSYGGKIQPRAHDNQLSYIGGHTKILVVDKNIKFDSLLSKAIALCDCVSIALKYQLPGEDLDALISVINDDDLEHLINEYDRLYRISPKPVRFRIFVFPSPSLNSSDRSLGFDETKTDTERFVEALNSAPIFSAPPQPVAVPSAAAPPMPPAANNVDFLFGFDKSNVEAVSPPTHQPTGGGVQELGDQGTIPVLDDQGLIGSDRIQKHIEDLEKLRIEDLEKLRIEEQEINKRKNDEISLSSGGFTGSGYNKLPDKPSQIPVVPGGFPYWRVNNEQPVYMIPANAYPPAAMMRPVNGAPIQGYYTVQRMPAEIYRDQQHHQIYSMIPQGGMPPVAAANLNLQPQKVTGYSGGGEVMTEGGYTHVAYDSSTERQVVYSAPVGVMGAPTAPYQGLGGADTRAAAAAGALNVEAAVKVAPKATQASV